MTLAPDVAAVMGELDFDPDALHQKYLAERDKRLRADGIAQFIEVKEDFARYIEDPWVAPGFNRAPVFDEVEVALIGGGFGGLIMASMLREAGFSRIRTIDIAGDFGGTWYWNRYPGCHCDVESYIYMPLLEKLGYIPKHRYAFAPEIFEHSRNLAKHYRLYDDALLQTAVTEMRWDDIDRRWIISTNRGDRFKAQYVSLALGSLSRPKLPGISGIDKFKGHTFLSSRWDYSYTGGDHNGNLVGLKDKRVGIVGTGATGIQIVPYLAESAKETYVFQRTPACVDLRNNADTDFEWAATLKPGWQEERQRNFNTFTSGGEQEVDLVNDVWTKTFRELTGGAARDIAQKLGRPLTDDERFEVLEIADYKKMNWIRARVDSIVKDPATAAALKPWYRLLCRRPNFHDEYLQAFNRPNVFLVDTAGKGVERMTERAVVVNGREYELDCMIFATGFEVSTPYTQRAGFDIIGRNGETLSKHWSGGMRTLHGVMAHGFPNCFFLGYIQNANTASAIDNLQEPAKHVAYMVTEARARGHEVLEPTAEAENAYVEEFERVSRPNLRFWQECTPSYLSHEGQTGARTNGATIPNAMFGLGSLKFFAMMEEWRRDGRLEGLALS